MCPLNIRLLRPNCHAPLKSFTNLFSLALSLRTSLLFPWIYLYVPNRASSLHIKKLSPPSAARRTFYVIRLFVGIRLMAQGTIISSSDKNEDYELFEKGKNYRRQKVCAITFPNVVGEDLLMRLFMDCRGCWYTKQT